MGVSVLWTDFALSQLINYYKIKVNSRIAKKLVRTLVEEIKKRSSIW